MSILLVDTISVNFSNSKITESYQTKDGRFMVEGVLQRAEAQNQNGRVYPAEILQREVKKYKNREIKENSAYGELDHPDLLGLRI